jgi:[ribosomal protein S18]-alanine N-acetyltransferase
MDEGIVIRPMLRLDLPLVRETERRAQSFPWAASLFAASLAAGHEGWLLEVGRTPAGHGVLSLRSEARLLNLSIHPDYRGRGLGRRLLLHLLERARLHTAAGVRLLVRAGNQEALRLYTAVGFVEVGRRRRYYPAGYSAGGGREDAFVLRLTL